MIAFVDDSGDEGTGGNGSRWLMFGCAMVADADIASVLQQCRVACMMAGKGKHRWIHFKDMNHDDRDGVIKLLTDASWQGVIVASDTREAYPASPLINPRYQYNYTARYVVERISQYAKTLQEPATIYFEQRRNFNIDDFREYVQRLLARGGLVCLNSAARFDKWNRAAVR